MLLAILVTSCSAAVPYRTLGFDYDREISPDVCKKLYDQNPGYNEITNPDNKCWKRSAEERDAYDLLVVEFDDQGWIQGTERDPADRNALNHLELLFRRLADLFETHKARGLSLVVFVHGWHHSADANDANVRNFRGFLRQIEALEGAGGRRVVGIYAGWRGESVTVPLLNALTFWDRKNTGERVAQGSIRALLLGLNEFQYRKNYGRESHGGGAHSVRMLTVGHSFGGLIVFESLSTEFLRSAAVLSGPAAHAEFARRVGDLVVIANPAFEGTRYESLHRAGQRLVERPGQLPLLVVATSTADWATGLAFPAARRVSTLFEKAPGDEYAANVKAVGHNTRYTTHELGVCPGTDSACQPTCADEAEYVKGLSAGLASTQYLCEQLKLTSVGSAMATKSPFMVVQTTGAVMKGHNDIFNPKFIAFVRQMYLAVLWARHQ